MPAPRTRATLPSSSSAQVHFEDCWAKTTPDGKPGISVRDHCLNVGCVAEALVGLLSSPLRNLLPQSAPALAALHDIGKVSPGFQAKCEAWLAERTRRDAALREGWSCHEADHAKISQFTVQELLAGSGAQAWAAAVGAHHGRLKGERVRECEPWWEEERIRLAGELIEEFGVLPGALPSEAALWFLAGLITVSDWIGSDERYFRQNSTGAIHQKRRDAELALAAIHWKAFEARQGLGFADCFPEITTANALQLAAVEVIQEPGVYLIEAPMGSGKTEAALGAAYKLIASKQASGLYFALPTRAASSRIHLRIQPFLENISADQASVRLAHGASWLVESNPPAQLSPAIASDKEARDHARSGSSWFGSAKRALLEPFGVGTVDQALLGVVAAKHFFVRQFSLAGKVVVLDEVHSYDVYTGTLIEKLIKRLRELQCTVIILTATLTETRRRELLQVGDAELSSAAYPRISGLGRSLAERACQPPPSKAVQIRNISGGPPVEEVIDRASKGDCVLWIRNTVDDAQETYRGLQSARVEGGPEVAVLHSRFPFFRREQLESEWMTRLGRDATQRPAGCVLVSTQIAEQSVDIDADLLVTDLAPTDMLLQRLGRLWRHSRTARSCLQPEGWIRTPRLTGSAIRGAGVEELLQALGKSARIYAPYVLLRSLEQWRDLQSISLPDGIRAILEATYAHPAQDEPASWVELRKQLEQRKEKLTRLALTASNVWSNPPLPDEEGVQTRYNTYPTMQVLLAREIALADSDSARVCLLDGSVATAHARRWSFETAKAIHRNLVPVPRWAVAQSFAAPPNWLVKHVTEPAVVGVVAPDGRIRGSSGEEQTMLSYHTDQGVMIMRDRRPAALQEEPDESYD